MRLMKGSLTPAADCGMLLPAMFKIRNRWHALAALVAALAWAAHEGLGLIGFGRRMLDEGAAADGAMALSFSLWNAGSALLLIFAAAFAGAAVLGRAVFLAGAATLMALGGAIAPVLALGFHQQPGLAALQGATFALMALFGMLGLWKSHEGGNILRR